MFVEKTEEEISKLNDDELFAYLDARASYLKTKSAPLSDHLIKNYAYMTEALSNMTGSGEIHKLVDNDKLDEIIKETRKKSNELFDKKQAEKFEKENGKF